MNQIGIFERDTWVKILNFLGYPLIGIYLICMILAPWIAGGGDWKYVQSVWDRWQSLNVGMIAFTSSIVAFSISRYNEAEQRERNFTAAKAFLPEALSELTTYLKLSSSLLMEAWQRVKDRAAIDKTVLMAPMPLKPVGINETFSRCIEFAEPDVGKRLAYILMRLQIHHSRLQELESNFRESGRLYIGSANIISYLHCLAELQALTNRLFAFARDFEKFDGSDLGWEDFRTAYFNLDIHAEDLDDLVGYTQRAIKRNNSGKET